MSAERLQQLSDPGELPELPSDGELVESRYRVSGELGRGGMGVVLAARDEMLGRDVALKVMLPKMMRSAEALERFSNEARSLARLESRHVVRVLDFGVISQPPASASLPFMVLELLRGEDLFSFAQREGTLSPDRVVRFMLQACDGLAAAHALGIVHRDLKPENLFVALEPDGSECLKVLDFGVARSHSRRVLTRDRAGVGSPGYMAPEQIESASQVDARADIWALGVVMYELLARRPAFVGDNAQSLCVQILNAPIAPLAELCPNLPPALVYVVQRCMERDPALRFQNVAELAEALAPLNDAMPPSDAERIRHRLDAPDAVTQGLQLTPVRHPTPVDELSEADIVEIRGDTVGPSRSRRVLSLLIAALLMVPVVLLLRPVLQAPELAPARAMAADTAHGVRSAWAKLRDETQRRWSGPNQAEPEPEQQR